jgi:hypothetical protein
MAGDMEQVLILSRWGARWVKHAWNILVEGNTREQFANKLLGKFTEESKEPSSYVDLHVYDSVHTVINKDGGRVVGHVERKKKVLSKGRRSNFSCAIAQLAYNKFGERPMSEANVLVTRRWIQKLLEEAEYKDLRTCDKNIAIDRALFLSFVPTNAFRQMKVAVQTRAWKNRVDVGGVFGKVFCLMTQREASSEADCWELMQ